MPSRARERFTEPHPNQIAQWFHPLLRKQALQAWAARDAGDLLFYLSSGQRFPFVYWYAFPGCCVRWGRKWVNHPSDPFLHALVKEGWEGSEGVPRLNSQGIFIDDEDVLELFQRFPVFDPALPRPDAPTVVYRGCRPNAWNGISWTIDPAVAYAFTNMRGRAEGRIYRRLIRPDDVVATFGGRDECEYVCRPPEEIPDDVTDELLAAGLESAHQRWYSDVTGLAGKRQPDAAAGLVASPSIAVAAAESTPAIAWL